MMVQASLVRRRHSCTYYPAHEFRWFARLWLQENIKKKRYLTALKLGKERAGKFLPFHLLALEFPHWLQYSSGVCVVVAAATAKAVSISHT